MLTPSQFASIQSEAERLGIPRGFQRAVLREYLQCEIIALLASLRGSEKFALIGGTGLRLLYDLDRFSEDLDFDNCGLPAAAAADLWRRLTDKLKEKNYAVNYRQKSTGAERGGKLIFHNLLFSLGLSRHREETVMIKIEYTAPRPAPRTTTSVLNRFGFVTQITTESLPVLCARKLLALKQRRRLQPRDLYDLVWLFARRVAPDKQTLKNFGATSLPALKNDLLRLLQSHQTEFAQYERDLAPWTLNQENRVAIRHLPALLEEFLI